MRVEITEKKLKDAGYDLVEGDTLTVPDELGADWCGRGWAKDTEGKVATGERIVQGATVRADSAKHVARDSNEKGGRNG
jgi:hypothetical protein